MKSARHLMLVAMAAAGLTVGATKAAAAEPALKAEVLERMSEQAESAAQHANVARHYRLRGDELTVKAEQHEAQAKRLQNTVNPIAGKWPAMGRNHTEREMQLAVQARRAAEECYARANRHVGLAVERQLASN